MSEEEVSRQGLIDTVRQPLSSIFNALVRVQRTDESGWVTTWVLRLVDITPYPQSFVMFTGGGSVLLAESQYRLVSAKRSPSSFLFVPKEGAPVLNALGGCILRRRRRKSAWRAARAHHQCQGESMSDPVSLRNIPPDVLKIAHALSAQTGLPLGAVLRLALSSGILVEATKLAPGQDGTYGGLDAGQLARALRRHLGSAIDLLLEQGEHPYHVATSREEGSSIVARPVREASVSLQAGDVLLFNGSMGEELEALGIGLGLAETIRRTQALE